MSIGEILKDVTDRLIFDEAITKLHARNIVPPQELKLLVHQLVNESDIDSWLLANSLMSLQGWSKVFEMRGLEESEYENITKSTDEISPWLLKDGVMYVANPYDEEVMKKVLYSEDTKDKFDEYGLLPLSITSTDLWRQGKREKETLDTEQISTQSVELFTEILATAIERKSSDVHFQPNMNGDIDIKIRVDGMLMPIKRYGGSIHMSLIRHIFYNLSDTKYAPSKPQDASFEYQVPSTGKVISVRVSSIPQYRTGVVRPRVVLRIFDKAATVNGLDELGLCPSMLESIKSITRRPQGFFVITGPTGSGKSTSLYSFLSYINEIFPEKNIMTLEDPVEQEHPNFSQIQVDENISFAEGLRAILRQDPDVILVGEIRDKVTAEVAFQASMTGHLVLSTLHTTSAHQAIDRINSLGINRTLFSETTLGITAQRLTRRLCVHCKKPADELYMMELSKRFKKDSIVLTNNLSNVHVHNPDGCDHCTNGYAGRCSVVELLTFNDEVRETIIKGASVSDLKNKQLKNGTFLDLWSDGLRLVSMGITTIDELDRQLESYESTRASMVNVTSIQAKAS